MPSPCAFIFTTVTLCVPVLVYFSRHLNQSKWSVVAVFALHVNGRALCQAGKPLEIKEERAGGGCRVSG